MVYPLAHPPFSFVGVFTLSSRWPHDRLTASCGPVAQEGEAGQGTGDFLALTLNSNGTVRFAFDTGDGTQYLQSQGVYTDGSWHSVTATRLTVDDLTLIALDVGDESLSVTVPLVRGRPGPLASRRKEHGRAPANRLRVVRRVRLEEPWMQAPWCMWQASPRRIAPMSSRSWRRLIAQQGPLCKRWGRSVAACGTSQSMAQVNPHVPARPRYLLLFHLPSFDGPTGGGW